MTDFVGHFLLFTLVAIAALMVPLLIGLLVRPKLPTAEKESIYECGEPTIGSSYIQFDLRFYVVALLFIIFDVEIAFFFPWSTIYGPATQLADTRLSEAARAEVSAKMLSTRDLDPANIVEPEAALQLATIGLGDILIFFGVLLVGFAYVWKRGDLDWVRSMTQQVQEQASLRPRPPPPREPTSQPQSVA